MEGKKDERALSPFWAMHWRRLDHSGLTLSTPLGFDCCYALSRQIAENSKDEQIAWI